MRNLQLISEDNQLYKLYLLQFKREKPLVQNEKVTLKSDTMSYVLEKVVREWVKSSKYYSNERIIYYEIVKKKEVIPIFIEMDYVLIRGNHCIVGELKASSNGLKGKAIDQLIDRKALLRDKFNSVEAQYIWIDFNYRHAIEPLDEFSPDFTKSNFRTIEIEKDTNKFKHLHLSAEDVFNWGVKNKLINTPELFPAAMIEFELMYERKQVKNELDRTRKAIKFSQGTEEIEKLQLELIPIQKSLCIADAKLLLSRQGWALITEFSEKNLSDFINQLGETLIVKDEMVLKESNEAFSTDMALDFHTETHYAKYIILQCINQTDKGGEVLLTDAEKAYHRLSLNQRKELESVIFEDTFLQNDKVNTLPLVSSTGLRRYFYPFNKKQQSNNEGLKEFNRIIKESEPISIFLKPNEILIFDNHRILNGRTKIEGNKKRYLKRILLSKISQQNQ